VNDLSLKSSSEHRYFVTRTVTIIWSLCGASFKEENGCEKRLTSIPRNEAVPNHDSPESATHTSAKTVFIAEVVPGRHLAEFSLDLQPANAPGMLAAASEVLAKHRVNILSGFHDPPHWSFFADLTESDCDSDQVQADLSSVQGVTRVLKADSPNGVLVDSLHFPLMWGKNRALLFRAQTVSSMLNRVIEMFGKDSPVAKVMLHQLGEAAGKAMYTATKAEVGDSVRNELVNLINIYSAAGWGVFRVSEVNVEACTATVVALDNFECTQYQGTGSGPFSQFVRGHLAGLFSGIFGCRVNAVETACLAHGESYCEFSIGPV
jgi:predicted hydrocarbon binding protein